MDKTEMDKIEYDLREIHRISKERLELISGGIDEQNIKSIKSILRILELRIKNMRINIKIFEMDRQRSKLSPTGDTSSRSRIR